MKILCFSQIFLLINFITEVINHLENENMFQEEIEYLTELPLIELIRIKNSINQFNIFGECNRNTQRMFVRENRSIISEYLKDENIGAEKANDSNEDIIESRDLPVTGRDLSSLPYVGRFIKKILPNKNVTFSIFGVKEKLTESGKNSVERSYEQYEDHKESTKIETIFQISVTGLSFLAFGGYLLCLIVQAIKSKGTTYYHPASTGVASLTTYQNSLPIKKIKVYRRSKRSFKKKLKNFQYKNQNMLASPSPDEMYSILKLFAEGYVKLVDY